MVLPFLKNRTKKREHIVAIDLGARTTKAVYMLRKGDRFQLANFTVQQAPPPDKAKSPQGLGELLKGVQTALGAPTREVALVVGVGDAMLRHAELPQVPISDMRMMLKFNSKNYLQQELPDHVFDCHIVPPRQNNRSTETKANQKFKVLVGTTRKQVVDDLKAAAKTAGLSVYNITPGIVSPVNAFELAHPDLFASEALALVDIGFQHSSISILIGGELILSRVVAIGGDRLTSDLAESMGITYEEAEGIKIGMPQEVQATLQANLFTLGRELRASIDFFEHQHDKAVGQVFVSGGTARSELILQTLQSELMVPCKAWNPTGFMKMALAPQQMGEIEQVAPQLAVAVGGALAAC